jgi:uncharacterized membrane protein YgaE (UPF0421/DUF939 family)
VAQSDQTVRPAAQRRAQRRGAISAFVAMLRAMPFRERVGEGALMALQAVCGASLAYWIGRYLHTPQAFWAAMTAIAVVQHSYVDTQHLARDQFFGAMIGGVCGLIGALYGGGYYLAYAVAIAAAMIVSWAINIGSAARLAAITATIMLLVPSGGAPWQTMLLRLGEVTLGTVSALLVSRLIGMCERRWFAKHP